MNWSRLYVVGFLLVFVGLALLFLGSIGSSSSGSFGGVIFVGPIPIAFGSGPGSGTLVLTAVLISLVMVLIFFFSLILSRRRGSPYV